MIERLTALLTLTSGWELLAVALAIAYVLLAIRQSLWCWPAAIGSASIYAVLFTSGQLYMESALQVFYVVMAIYGWLSWRRGKAGQALLISTRSWRWHLLWWVGLLALVVVLATIMERYTNADMARLDTLTTVFSLFATFLVARKVLENWLYWVVIDALYVMLFWSKGFYPTAILFAAYTVIALFGYLRWRRDWSRQKIPDTSTVSVSP